MRITTIGVALVALGFGIFVLTFVRLYKGEALQPQTKVPGVVTAELPEPGRYYLWDHHWTVFEGERIKYEADCPETAKVEVRDAQDKQLEFTADSSQSWSIGNNSKTSIGYVDVAEPTTLQFSIDDVGRERVVSVSQSSMKEELWARLGGFGIGVVVGLAGAVVSLIGLLTRRRGSVE